MADNEQQLTGDALVNFGGEIKALGETPEGLHVGGYLVRFSSEKDPDLTGDYFTADTDFGLDDGEGKTLPVMFHHGQPLKTREGGEIIITRRVGKGTIQLDDAGVLIDAIIYNRDEYEKAIAESMKMFGWSSGALGHLVEREPGEKASWIKRWWIGEASITPTPAEPRNSVLPLKMLTHNPEASEAGEDKPAVVEIKSDPILESATTGDKMENEEIKTMIDTAVDAAVKAVVSALPPTNGGGVQVVKDEGDQPFGSFGEQLQAVKNFALSNGQRVDPRLASKNTKQLGLNEGLPSEGGFLVQQDFSSELLKRAYDMGVLASRVRRIPISANANGLKINAVAETSRVTGSRWGGVQAYWIAEAGTKTPSMPAFRQIDLNLKKLIGLFYSTDELMQDTAALGSVMGQAFNEEFAYMLDAGIYNGPGGGQPLGMLPSAAAIAVARFGGPATVSHEDIVNMYARMWAKSRANAIWVYNQDVEPQLFTMGLTVGAGGTPSFMPPGGLSGSPYATLLGRPAIPMEQCSTLGTLGDIAFIDPSQYIAIDKGGMQSASSIHVQFLTDQTAFRFVYRFDGQPSWVAPLTPATGSANTLSPFVFLAA